MVAGRGVAQLITEGQIINFLDPTMVYLGNGHLLAPFTLTLVLVMLLITYFLVRRTALGLFIESVGDNGEASRFSGINAKQVKFLVYTFSGLCAGLAGLVACSNIRSADANNIGLYLELDAILAVVVGGTSLQGGRFYLVGAVVGGLFVQTLTTTLYARNVSSDIRPYRRPWLSSGFACSKANRSGRDLPKSFGHCNGFSSHLALGYLVICLLPRDMIP
jgi:galactofuranose transport system permease protein